MSPSAPERAAAADVSDLLNTHPPFVAEGGYYREEAIMLLRRFYMSENQNGMMHLTSYIRGDMTGGAWLMHQAPNPKKKTSRVLKTDIPPPPSGSSTPNASGPASRPASVPPQRRPLKAGDLDLSRAAEALAIGAKEEITANAGIASRFSSAADDLQADNRNDPVEPRLPIGSTLVGTPG